TVIAGACGGEVEPRDDLVEALLCTPWEGMPWREVRRGRAREWARYLFRPLEVCGVAEDLRALAARMDTALRAIAATHPGQQVVAVSHGDPLKAGIIALTVCDMRQLQPYLIHTDGLVRLELGGHHHAVLQAPC